MRIVDDNTGNPVQRAGQGSEAASAAAAHRIGRLDFTVEAAETGKAEPSESDRADAIARWLLAEWRSERRIRAERNAP